MAFLQTIRTAEIGPHKVAAQIIGRVKNNVRSVFRRRIREMRHARSGSRERPRHPASARQRFYPGEDADILDEGFSDAAGGLWERLGGAAAMDQSTDSEGVALPSVPDVSALLDDLEQRKVIARADREIIETTVIDGFPLKDLASTPAEYQRLKKRRQRALTTIRDDLIRRHEVNHS